MFLGENEGVGSGLSVFPAHQAQKNRLSYKEELRQQVCVLIAYYVVMAQWIRHMPLV